MHRKFGSRTLESATNVYMSLFSSCLFSVQVKVLLFLCLSLFSSLSLIILGNRVNN